MEGGVFGDELGQPVFRKAEVHVAGQLIEGSTRDELGINLLLDTECLCLLRRQARAELAGNERELTLVGEPEVRSLDLDVTDDDHSI